ncbi:hypothetical protein [Granulicella pectinivorans]|uniref:hypothetical protein n=1 Tax=Granulicella pectinivorans TaxID=474950 RepID=UPI0011405DBE|nr:hypothetical protein [Granulicella pectinivorans]
MATVPVLQGQETDTSALKPPARAPGIDPQSHVSAYGNILTGLNAGLTFSAVHDSSTGWYSVATPAVSYSFTPRYSADASMSIYPYRLTPNQSTTATASNRLLPTHGDLGDMLVEGHATFSPGPVRDIATIALTLPTGNHTDGLGTGRATFNVDNRIERYFGQTGLLVDVGGGDSAGLVNRLVTEDDSSLGPLAQFQVGFLTWLPRSISLQSVAYEQLPIGDQKTYTTLTRPGGPPRTVVSGRKVTEDNGFTTSLYMPLTSHLVLSGSYNRSLRLHLDTVSTGVTFVWKGFPVRHKDSLIDRAMREAEFGKPIPKPTD